MKLAMFKEGGRARIGVVEGDDVVDVTAGTGGLSTELADWLPGLDTSWKVLALLATLDKPRYRLADVELLPPVPRPPKFLAIGGNYESHLREVEHLDIPLSPHQIWFNKQTSCVSAPYADMVMPKVSKAFDYEIELAVVIGRPCKDVSAEQASRYIAGYMVCNDGSVRDWQMRTSTMTLGKSFETHGPTGPWLVTADEIGDPHTLRLRTWVNDELRQDAYTSEMIHDVYAQIAELSTVMTLMPGDILATGTPAGVGVVRQPPQYLQVGDVVTMEIDRIGTIRNRVVGA
ncbi:UNVERIFIED_ORG: 2-keto-4-pentenoate hydratase/2-oxohepta-3-ene-1,7-dioic acid hydratase in catechol pathway [Paraburkholderia sediminicola]|nr:2-keto-4-pentenoate hydratase/2-oxohepta-3-ene-1,7-dioic acid hydratase in catechol pathway [Paraburkholderia sediminicola]